MYFPLQPQWNLLSRGVEYECVDVCRNEGVGILPWSPLMGWVVMLGVNPDSKVRGANMGPIWGRQDPGEPHVGPMNFVILERHRLIGT